MGRRKQQSRQSGRPALEEKPAFQRLVEQLAERCPKQIEPDALLTLMEHPALIRRLANALAEHSLPDEVTTLLVGQWVQVIQQEHAAEYGDVTALEDALQLYRYWQRLFLTIQEMEKAFGVSYLKQAQIALSTLPFPRYVLRHHRSGGWVVFPGHPLITYRRVLEVMQQKFGLRVDCHIPLGQSYDPILDQRLEPRWYLINMFETNACAALLHSKECPGYRHSSPLEVLTAAVACRLSEHLWWPAAFACRHEKIQGRYFTVEAGIQSGTSDYWFVVKSGKVGEPFGPLTREPYSKERPT